MSGMTETKMHVFYSFLLFQFSDEKKEKFDEKFFFAKIQVVTSKLGERL